jgi:MerR family copper efflux transcriptional regulator
MASGLTIGRLSRESGVPARTIRFYESLGVLPCPARTTAGYRLYGDSDIRRLRLIRRARLVGLDVRAAGALVQQAFASECSSYVRQLGHILDQQCAEIDRRVAELHALRAELSDVRSRLNLATAIPAGQTVAECGQCPLIDERTELDGMGSACGAATDWRLCDGA